MNKELLQAVVAGILVILFLLPYALWVLFSNDYEE